MAEKAQVMGPGRFKRREPVDSKFSITVQAGMADAGQCFNDVGETERHTAPAIVQVLKRFDEVSALQREALSALITLSVMSCFGLT